MISISLLFDLQKSRLSDNSRERMLYHFGLSLQWTRCAPLDSGPALGEIARTRRPRIVLDGRL